MCFEGSTLLTKVRFFRVKLSFAEAGDPNQGGTSFRRVDTTECNGWNEPVHFAMLYSTWNPGWDTYLPTLSAGSSYHHNQGRP